jgi:hypothetical protein
MISTRALSLLTTVALTSLLCGCAGSHSGTQASGARGVQVAVTKAGKCGYRVVSDPSQTPTTPLPKMVRIDVACSSLTKPSDIATYLSAVRAPDASKCTGELLVWGGLPMVIGTDDHGVHWLVHLPASSCGAPKEPAVDLTWQVARTGHLPSLK